MTLKMVSFLTLGAAFKHLVRMPRETATVSARALKVAGASFAFFFHHHGTSPQRIGINSRLLSRSMTASNVMARWQIALGSCRNTQTIESDNLAPS
ncbi:MAG: hypothetical protein WAN49_11300 [Pseudolabrys sp.]